MVAAGEARITNGRRQFRAEARALDTEELRDVLTAYTRQHPRNAQAYARRQAGPAADRVLPLAQYADRLAGVEFSPRAH